MNTIEQRMDILEEKIRDENFRKNIGQGNKVGYYVFDYDPADELKVRERVRQLKETNTQLKYGYQLCVYDLYELMISLLKEEDTLDDLKELEEEEGTGYVFEAIRDILRSDEPDGLIVRYIVRHTPEDAVVFLTGVGKCFPILRGHKVLNSLFQVMDRNPAILLYPGKYDGISLNIFGELKEDNYYRATLIVEH